MIKTGRILQRNRFIGSNGCSKWIEFFFFENNTAKTENDALYDTNYPPGTPVDINTIQEALYMVKKNDISFTIANTYLVISEHQSTINYNMPLRDLWYIAEIYRKMVD